MSMTEAKDTTEKVISNTSATMNVDKSMAWVLCSNSRMMLAKNLGLVESKPKLMTMRADKIKPSNSIESEIQTLDKIAIENKLKGWAKFLNRNMEEGRHKNMGWLPVTSTLVSDVKDLGQGTLENLDATTISIQTSKMTEYSIAALNNTLFAAAYRFNDTFAIPIENWIVSATAKKANVSRVNVYRNGLVHLLRSTFMFKFNLSLENEGMTMDPIEYMDMFGDPITSLNKILITTSVSGHVSHEAGSVIEVSTLDLAFNKTLISDLDTSKPWLMIPNGNTSMTPIAKAFLDMPTTKTKIGYTTMKEIEALFDAMSVAETTTEVLNMADDLFAIMNKNMDMLEIMVDHGFPYQIRIFILIYSWIKILSVDEHLYVSMIMNENITEARIKFMERIKNANMTDCLNPNVGMDTIDYKDVVMDPNGLPFVDEYKFMKLPEAKDLIVCMAKNLPVRMTSGSTANMYEHLILAMVGDEFVSTKRLPNTVMAANKIQILPVTTVLDKSESMTEPIISGVGLARGGIPPAMVCTLGDQ